MKNKEVISKYRAEVIEMFINIECLIDAIICQHYFKRIMKQFFLKYYMMNISVSHSREEYSRKL